MASFSYSIFYVKIVICLATYHPLINFVFATFINNSNIIRICRHTQDEGENMKMYIIHYIYQQKITPIYYSVIQNPSSILTGN